MTTNPNQRTVTVVGAKKQGDGKAYGTITREAERVAVHILDDNTASYFLFVHFALHKDTHKFAFSPAALHRELGISTDRCRTAFRKLIESGYLVQDRPGSNAYTFYQMPPQYEGMIFNAESNAEAEAVEQSPGQQEVSPQTEVTPPADIGIPVDGDTYAASQGEGYPCQEGEDIPAEGERNITPDITDNNTVNIEHPISSGQIHEEGEQQDKRHNVSPMEQRLNKYGYGRLVYDCNGGMADFIPSFFPLPSCPQDSEYDDLPF